MRTSEVVDALRGAGCVFAEDEAALLEREASSTGDLAAMVARRVAGEPLEQIVGWVDFAGVRVLLEPGVFVPRQRTALMVDEAGPRRAGGTPPGRPGPCCGAGG